MLRASYIGDMNANAGSSTPLQAEAAAYFARMTSSPSNTYREAVNRAIYKWKRQGAWALLKGLWLFCAETDQAARLSVIGDAPRDATKTGTPTFVAGKGYEGFSATAGIAWPITAAILADDNFMPIIAGRVVLDREGVIISSDAGDIPNVAGHFQSMFSEPGVPLGLVGPSYTLGTLMSAYGVGGRELTVCGGMRYIQAVDPQGYWGSAAGSAARSSNYHTTLASSGPLRRLTAIAYLSSGASMATAQKFTSTLNEMLCDLGALD